MKISEILRQFADLTGLSASDCQGFAPMARLCAAHLRSRLRPDVDEAEHARELCTAAASLLLCQYAALPQSADGSFKLGDLSISGGAKISLLDARNARDELMSAIAPLLRADGAFLVQVEAV